MGASSVPVALSDRLGEPATAALVQMFEEERQARTEVIVQQCTGRFERRLVEETSKMRNELRTEFGQLRTEFGQLRTEFGQLRTEFGELRSDVRIEISSLRTEMATQRFELLKWAFLFWVGQFVSVVGFVGLMLRMRP
jgi:predicted RNase H-like nuclease (RuvC/YqgF family)